MKMRTPTISDVAKHAGVSPMTVSRVINGESNVKDATKSIVMDSIKALNYVPNISARALAGNRSYKLALLYANPSAFYLSELLVGALEEISQYGHQLLVHKVTDSESQQAVLKGLNPLIGRFDGVIVPPPLSDYVNVREFLMTNDIPAVFLSGNEGQGRSCKICIDDYDAAKAITNYLLELGHKRIAIIKGHPNQFSSDERLRGFKDALSSAGLSLERGNTAQGYFTYNSGLKAARKLLARENPPTAIFAANDDMAAATLAVAASKGVNVPTELSVAGFDDSPLASSVFPRLTTIKQPLSEMAAAAIDFLLEFVSGENDVTNDNPGRIVMPYQIIKGESAVAPSVDA